MKRARITVQKDEVLVVRRLPAPVRAWCEACDAEADMVTVEAATALARVTPRTIYRWVEAGKIHFSESPGGLVLICCNSLRSGPRP